MLSFYYSHLPKLMSAAGFSFTENSSKVITTALLSMVPTFEGRYAVSVGMGMGMPPVYAFFIALIFSTIPMPFIFLLLKPVLKWLYTLPIKPLRKFAAWIEERSKRKGGKVDAKGLLGLYLFVAIPLPGTGVWTGTGIATLFDMKRGPAAVAIVLGNITACVIMTLSTYGVMSIF